MRTTTRSGLVLTVALSLGLASAQAQVVPGPPGMVPPSPPTATPPPAPPPPPAPLDTPETTLPPPAPPSAPSTAGEAPSSSEQSWPVAPRRRRPALIRERLRMLDSSLIPLAERSRDSRITSSVVSLVTGAVLIGVGIGVDQALNDPGSAAALLPPLFYVTGSFSMGSGLISLVWAPARERLSEQYQAMPRRTAADRRNRVLFGEQALDDIASDAKRRQILSGLGSIAITGATLGVYFTVADTSAFDDTTMYLLIGLSAIPVLTEIATMFSRTDEQRLRDNYRRQLQQLREYAEMPDE